jgi:hypothetical protein
VYRIHWRLFLVIFVQRSTVRHLQVGENRRGSPNHRDNPKYDLDDLEPRLQYRTCVDIAEPMHKSLRTKNRGMCLELAGASNSTIRFRTVAGRGGRAFDFLDQVHALDNLYTQKVRTKQCVRFNVVFCYEHECIKGSKQRAT